MWGFEMIQWIEPKVPVHKAVDHSQPDGIWMFMDSILIFDQVKRLITAVSYADLDNAGSPELAWEKALERNEDYEKHDLLL